MLSVAACSPIVVSTVLSVVAGVVVERFGVRLCLVVGTLVLGVSWVMIAQETPFVVIITARVFQGVVCEPPSRPPCLAGTFFFY